VKYEYFDEETLKRVNEILKVAEELVRENTTFLGDKLSREEWDKYLKQIYVSMRYYNPTIDVNYNKPCWISDNYRGEHTVYRLLKKRKAIGFVYHLDEVVLNEVYEKLGELVKPCRIFLHEHEFLEVKEEGGSDYFEAYLLYVLIHELRHIVDTAHIRQLELKWLDEVKTHKETAKILEQAKDFNKEAIKRILSKYAKYRHSKKQ